MSGFDGSNRWNTLINVLYGGMPPIMQYVFLKFVLDRWPFLNRAYFAKRLLLKITIDGIIMYGVLYFMILNNEHVELITGTIVMLCGLIYLT